MRRLLIRLLLLLPLAAAPACAQQQALLPATTQVEIRAFGLGFFPLDGKFERFRGWIRYDPATPTACQVSLRVETASLTMSNRSVREQITGPEFMDVSRFPELSFLGACQGDAIQGDLSLHGETHPFDLELARRPATLTATGHLRRGNWGMTTRSLTAGSTIRIRVEIPNPLLPAPNPGPRR